MTQKNSKGKTLRRRRCSSCGFRWSTVEIGFFDYKKLLRLKSIAEEAMCRS